MRKAGGVDPKSPPMPTGNAYPIGYVEHWHGPVVTWRLEVHKAELPGRWVCDRMVLGAIG